MSWNLFEKIINAFKPRNQSEQTSEVSDPSQQWPEVSTDASQSWPDDSSQQQSCPENSTEQQESSQEPSPSYQETPSTPQQNEWKQD